MCTMQGSRDHVEFYFDRLVYRNIKDHLAELAFTTSEIESLVVRLSTISSSQLSAASAATMNKVTAVLNDDFISQILVDSERALVCTLEESDAKKRWLQPCVKLAIVCSYMFACFDIADVQLKILGVYVKADERRSSSLCSRVADFPPHIILKAQIAEAIASCLVLASN